MSILDTWRDGTSHSQGETQHVQRVWRNEIGGVNVTVLWGHLDCPGQWVLHASPWFDTYDLGRCGDLTPEQAVHKATRLVSGKVDKMHAAFKGELMRQAVVALQKLNRARVSPPIWRQRVQPK